MSIAKMQKRKRDSEARLQMNDPAKMRVYSEVKTGSEGSETIQKIFINNTYITEGKNVSMTQKGSITYINSADPDYHEPLTNGDAADPQIMFTPEGDIMMGVVEYG